MRIRSSRWKALVLRVHQVSRAAFIGAAVLGLGLSWSAEPAQATVPGQVSYQGLLLDSLGAPVTGSASFVFRLYDAATGGSLLWTESHPGVSVTSGVYDVALGATTPLDATLVAGGELHLEIEVDGEILAPRERLLVVPYALRAAVAESAEQVGDVESAYLTEYLTKVPLDGANPPNLDPSEGLVDVDGDGLPNFLDPDNDGDGMSDAYELSLGFDINVVTARPSPPPPPFSIFPKEGYSWASIVVTVLGGDFSSGVSVVVGSQSPTPYKVTATSFKVDVTPQPAGQADFTVILPDGRRYSWPFLFR